MRVLFAVAILACGAAGTADAADIRVERGARGYAHYYYAIGERAGHVVSYDFEPGVVVRAYWLPPWQGRHYFPFGVRRENIRHRVSQRAPKAAESYFSYWSTTSIQESPRLAPIYNRAPNPEPAARAHERHQEIED